MTNKEYTLYFKGKNKYGHYHELPILTADLKTMDLYTCNYINYVDLFENLPINVRQFIKDELSYGINLGNNNELKELFYLINSDNNKEELLFNDDIDIVYINSLEVVELICNAKMTYKNFQNVVLNMTPSLYEKKRFEFFKYLYNKHVKRKELAKMIDTYDIEKFFGNLDEDNTLIASIATDHNNILVLCRKISQTDEGKRDLATKYKRLFSELNPEKSLIDYNRAKKMKSKDYDESKIIQEITESFNNFEKEYQKEYEIV